MDPITDEYKKGLTEDKSLYLDAQAIIQLDSRVLDKMMPYLTVYHGNPLTCMIGSRKQQSSMLANKLQISKANKKEMIFISGATECNNMCFLIDIMNLLNLSRSTNVYWIRVEHLKVEGFDVTYISVNSNDLIDLNELEAAIRPSTSLVSVMMMNNEIGVKRPIEEVGTIYK